METDTTRVPSVLVPLDGSELADQAIPYALALIEPGATVHFLRVMPDPEAVIDGSGRLLLTAGAVLTMNEDMAQDELGRAARCVGDIDATVRIETAFGDPTEEILRIVAERSIGLIVMASHGRGALGRWAFGSVADRIARTTPVPVMIVRANDEIAATNPAGIRRLIVPLDGSELAAKALPVAQTLASRLALPVHLLRVIEPMSLLTPAHGFGTVTQGGIYDDIYESLQTKAERSLAEIAARLRGAGVTASSEVSVGSAARNIAAAAGPGDVIVLTSHGRGGLRRWLLGSVAEQLVRSGPVPVILVPDAMRRSSIRSASPVDAGERAVTTRGA